MQARSPDVVRNELAWSIEASAARSHHRYYGSWTLVELTPRIVGLVVELSASLSSLTPEQYIARLSSARRQFARDGMRIYYAQARARSWTPPYIVLQNQRGEQGRLVEATPSLRNRGSSGDAHGILMLEDNVRPEDATYTVSFLGISSEERLEMPGSVVQEFTFDATDGRLFQILGGMVHTPVAVYAEPSYNRNYDSNNDGFSFGDALGFIGTIVEIIGLFLG